MAWTSINFRHSKFAFILLTLSGTLVMPAHGGFTAEGTCRTTIWDLEGKVTSTLNIPFEVKVAGRAWSIKVTDPEVDKSTRVNFNSCEIVFDGRDLFTSTRFSETVQKRAEAFQTADTYATVIEKTFPDSAGWNEKLLWLAFCAGENSPFDTNNLPLISINHVRDNLADVRGTYSKESGLPTSLEVFAKGLSAGGPRSEVIPLPAPFESGYLNFAFETRGETKAGSVALPKEAVATYYRIDARSNPPKRGPEMQVVLSVTESKVFAGPIEIPSFYGKADVVDFRFEKDQGRPFHYQQTAGSFVARTSANAKVELSGKVASPVWHGAAPTAKPLSPWSWSIIAILLAAPAVFLLNKVLRGRAETKS
jgi:hypothetical protein